MNNGQERIYEAMENGNDTQKEMGTWVKVVETRQGMLVQWHRKIAGWLDVADVRINWAAL